MFTMFDQMPDLAPDRGGQANGMENERWVLHPALGCSEKNVVKR